MPQRAPVSRRIVGAGFLALGLLYPAIRLSVVLAGSIDRVRQDFADDAYYYALIARNIADGNGSTFGGLVPTNGYQPLWQLLLVPIAAVSSGDAQVRLTFALAAGLFAAFVLFAWKFSVTLGARTEGLYATVYATAIGALLGNQFFNGMELALVVPAAMLVVLLLLHSPHRGQRGRSTAWYGVMLGLAMLLLALSRLDTLALPVACALVVLPRRRDRAVWRSWIITALVVAAGLAAYAVWNLSRFGTPVPVSGLAKALGGGTREATVSLLRGYLEFGDAGPVSTMWLGGQAVAVSFLALGLLHRAKAVQRPLFDARRDEALASLVQGLVLAQLLQLGYYTATSSWHLWEWYYYFVPLQLLVAGVVVARAALRTSWSAVLRRPAVAAAAACLSAAAGLALFVLDDPKTSWTTSSVSLGTWIDQNTAPDAVIAMGDRGGAVLWASNRRSVQLEGLVQDPDYLDVLRTHTVARYMVEQSVDYYVRGSTAGERTGRAAVPGHPGCWSFTEPNQGQGPKSSVVACDQDLVHSSTQDDGSVWQVWRFRADLQGGSSTGWISDQSGVPLGDPGCTADSTTPTAAALTKQWDYWDSCGGAEVSVAAEGLPAPPWGGERVFRWRKPAGSPDVYQKLNRTFTKDNWPGGSPGPDVPGTGSPADASGVYTVWQYIPSASFRLNPRHGWVVLSQFKENYTDAGGTFHQDPLWQVGCDNFSGATTCSLAPHRSPSFPLTPYLDRWVKWEFRLYQGSTDTSGHGGRVELWVNGRLKDTGYESQLHVGSAAFSPLSQTRGWVWIVGQYTSNQTTNGVPDYEGTDVTSYVGQSSVTPLR